MRLPFVLGFWWLKVYVVVCCSSTTPAHPSSDYRWKDYCPRVFRRLRAASNIDEADYMLSLAGSQALRQLNSPGKSGSMFLLSGMHLQKHRRCHG